MAVRRSALSAQDLDRLDRWWRAANYLSVGQIYLMDNPLLRDPLLPEHVKPRLLGHWGTTPGLTFVYAHLNRLLAERGRECLFVAGPGHGGPGVVAATYLEGTYSEVYPEVGLDDAGLRRLVTQFSFPGGIPSHAAPDTPGSINEGGELGYSLAHAYGAAFDNPDLLVTCVVGDGEAETGPLATSWHSTKFVDPRRDGAVLPVLHLNGFKIANPTVLARIPEDELVSLLRGYGHAPYLVAGSDPEEMHQAFAAALDDCLDEIDDIQAEARHSETAPPRRPWPMIVLRSPKGWTGPQELDGQRIEGSWRSHQVPFADARSDEDHRHVLEEWLRSYRPEELFDENGRVADDILRHRPPIRMSETLHANGGTLLRPLELPDFREHAVPVDAPGTGAVEATRVLGGWLREVMSANDDRFRMFAPDENSSNRLQDVMEVTDRTWNAEITPEDDHLAPDGRLMEILSEHTCQGWLEGYLLTGRHGLFSCYEAFIHIVGSMFNQHAKWLEACNDIAWRQPVASLNYLLTSHVWRQDHNGFSHQDPGFIDHVLNKKPELVRVYLPPDANTLLSTMDHCLRSQQYVNVVVAGKQPALQYLSMDEAVLHCARGAGTWEWASSYDGEEPEIVLACAGDVPTMETLAAAELLHQHVPDLRLRVVNVVDLMRLPSEDHHPHGMSDDDFDALFTVDRPVVFAHHGYPTLIHRLTYKRRNHANLHVRGYVEEGTTTTPFDMTVLNGVDRFHLAIDVLDRVPRLKESASSARSWLTDQLTRHHHYVRTHGEDMPEVRDWQWSPQPGPRAGTSAPERHAPEA